MDVGSVYHPVVGDSLRLKLFPPRAFFAHFETGTLWVILPERNILEALASKIDDGLGSLEPKSSQGH